MASFKVLGMREQAINSITVKYPNIWRLTGEAIDLWINDFIYEICADHNVSRKTAIEYFKTAIHKQRKEIQETKNALNTEETTVLSAEVPSEYRE